MMIDQGRVLSIDGDLAHVEVFCLQACRGCSARNVCLDHPDETGRLEVRNPIDASPGDSVLIDIPESAYNRALIKTFGAPLLSALSGLGLGALWSGRSGSPAPETGIFGFFAGLFLGIFLISRDLRKRRESFYPVILEITQQGGCHGQA